MTLYVYSFRRWQRRRRKRSTKSTARVPTLHAATSASAKLREPKRQILTLEVCGGSQERQAEWMLAEKKPYTLQATPPVPLRFATRNKLVAWEIVVKRERGGGATYDPDVDNDSDESTGSEEEVTIMYPERIGAGANYDPELSSDW